MNTQPLQYDFDYERLILICGGHIFFQTVAAAIELELFERLEQRQQATLKTLASDLALEHKPMRILLLGLCSLKLIAKSGDNYTNSPLAKMFFLKKSPRTLVNLIKWQHHINYKAMFHFTSALKANDNVGLQEFSGDEKTLYERLAHTPHLEKIFQDAMKDISDQSNTAFAKSVNLDGVKHLVDVGGGNGTNIVNLAKNHPNTKFSIFDSPTVCLEAKRNFASFPDLKNRLGAFEGNCFENDFPREADCILFCHFFTIWSENENLTLLKKCFASLKSGGRAMIFNMMQLNSEDGPLTAAMGSPYFLTLATGKGMLYTRNEYMKWFREAGFVDVTIQELPTDHAVIYGFKP